LLEADQQSFRENRPPQGDSGSARCGTLSVDRLRSRKKAQEWGLKENPFLRYGGDHELLIDADYKDKGLQLQFAVEDEGVFKMPWSATVTYRRTLGEWPEIVCSENLRATYITRDSDVPGADKPDF